jgi:hypothetical protein
VSHLGVGIAIGDPLQGVILVSGQTNSLEYKNPKDLARQMLVFMREEWEHLIKENGNSTAESVLIRLRHPLYSPRPMRLEAFRRLPT